MIGLKDYLEGYKTLLGESNDSPTSDNAIYYKIGKHKLAWKKITDPQKIDGLKRKYNIQGSHERLGIINFMRDTSPRILPDAEEIIHRKDWDLDGLIGETEYQLMHPHSWTMQSWILKSHKRRHDTLTIFECSNSKPYVTSSNRKNMFLNRYGAFTDNACIANPGIIPMEHSQFYPFRYDEWSHLDETPDTDKKYTWALANRFMTYVKKMGYKHVIVVMHNPHLQEWAQYLYDNDIEGCRDWLSIVDTPEFDKKMQEKYIPKFGGQSGLGLFRQRLMFLSEFSERYRKLLKSTLSEDDKKEFEKLCDILNIESNSKRAQELEEFNKSHDANVYDPTKGTTDSFDLLDADSATTQEKVDAYKKYVKRHLKGLATAYEEAQSDKDWHKHRVVFTVLDLLMDKNDDKLIDDLDTEYWNLYKAVKDLCEDNNDIVQLNPYCYCYKPLIDDLSKADVQKYTNKLGITAFGDKRRRKADK